MAQGIGAQDRDMTGIVFLGGGLPWAEAGEVYAFAIREANYDRRRAFDALPDFGTPRGTSVAYHPVDPTFPREREQGIPSW